jgi:hypothetical protein
VEGSRKIAERILAEAPPTAADRVDYAFRMATARSPRDAEKKVLLAIYHRASARFHSDPAAATRLLHVGESKCSPRLDPAEIAAWSIVATTILNLDETITKS